MQRPARRQTEKPLSISLILAFIRLKYEANQLLAWKWQKPAPKEIFFFLERARSTVMSLSTLLLTMIVTRVTGEITAGIFVYAFTLAQQQE